MRWPKYWSLSFSIIPSKEHLGLISFRMDWLDLLAVQGTLKSLLQHYSSKASILWRSTFFTVQLSHPYMITGKTIALTRWTFVGKTIPIDGFKSHVYIVIHRVTTTEIIQKDTLKTNMKIRCNHWKCLSDHIETKNEKRETRNKRYKQKTNNKVEDLNHNMPIIWRRKWQPTPVFLPGESQGQRSLVGGCLWGRTESDTTEAT